MNRRTIRIPLRLPLKVDWEGGDLPRPDETPLLYIAEARSEKEAGWIRRYWDAKVKGDEKGARAIRQEVIRDQFAPIVEALRREDDDC
jgi:hypothetical protein